MLKKQQLSAAKGVCKTSTVRFDILCCGFSFSRLNREFQTFKQTDTCTETGAQCAQEKNLSFMSPVCIQVLSKYVSLCKQPCASIYLILFIHKPCVYMCMYVWQEQEQIHIDAESASEVAEDAHKNTDLQNKRLCFCFCQTHILHVRFSQFLLNHQPFSCPFDVTFMSSPLIYPLIFLLFVLLACWRRKWRHSRAIWRSTELRSV